MGKKFNVTDEKRFFGGHILHRIVALRSFNDVEAGQLGGFIEKEDKFIAEWGCLDL